MSGSSAGAGGIYNTVNFNLYHYANNNPIRYTDPNGRSGNDTVDDIVIDETTINSQQQLSTVRPDQPYYQNSDELAGISHMCLSGCNFMTYLQVAQNETGQNMSAQEIQDLISTLQNTINPTHPEEMCLTNELNVRNPDILINMAFDILGQPDTTATVGYGAETDQVPDYTNITGTTALQHDHHKLGDSNGTEIYDPWTTSLELTNTSTINIYLHNNH